MSMMIINKHALVLMTLFTYRLAASEETSDWKRGSEPAGVVDPNMFLHIGIQDGVGQLTQKTPPFNEEQKKEILDLHNQYRSNVEPPAASMRFMTWNASLEETAQQWADGCRFDHGMPPGAEDDVGQNLYKGFTGDGLRATALWYNETHDFKFETNSCEGQDTQCGHYTQVVWDESHLLGCAAAACFDDAAITPWHFIVCHYKPAGNSPRQPYSVGAPCSDCSTADGGLCTDKLCITKDECNGTNSDCDCPLKCHNCGTLSSENCRCQCKRGWDSLDCSRPCKDFDRLCGANPGFPNNKSCKIPNVQSKLCRLMCGQCRALPVAGVKNPVETGEPAGNDDVCCAGKLCPDGYVLDPDVCNCVSLCPGPKCGVELPSGTTTLHSSIKMFVAGMLIWTMTL